ncbi:MAG: T9SS type A sorting domain-containing protein [Chlorobi bacterium]|nr:T9SS type A sorting domain-containing protein [Chlorobiota bacterium]
MKRIVLFTFLILSNLIAESQIPPGYYDAAAGYGGNGLKTALYNIIKGHKEYEYTADTTDVWDILKETDRDTINPDNVICLYSGFTRNAAAEYNDGNGWTREHVWAKSHGDFGTSMGPGTDVHHLRPADNSVNTERNNRWFAECSEEYIDPDGPTGSYESSTEWLWKPRDEVKGDVARMMFYMAARYEGENGEPDLELIDYIPTDNNSPLPLHAKLSDLLLWNEQDPVSDWERNRNNIIYNDYQHNRNPFIDHPEWANLIWKNEGTGYWFTSYPVTSVTDRIPYSYDITASSSNGIDLTIDCDSILPAWLTFNSVTNGIDAATATLTGSPTLSDTGIYKIYLNLHSPTDTIMQVFEITVSDGNPITFTSTPITSVYVGEQYTYNITATGDAGANFTLTGTKLPGWLSLTDNTGDAATLSGIPDIADLGADTVILTLTDDTKKTIQQEFIINVSVLNYLIISQYYEGTSNNKYIEITNVGNTDVDLSDYYLGVWGTTDSPFGKFKYGDALNGTINAGQTLIYKNANAAAPAYAVSAAYANTVATYYNGDDPVALTRFGDTWDDRVDCIYASINGKTTTWGLDKGFYRKPDVLAGNRNMSVLDGTGEWVEITITQADDAVEGTSEYLGYHIFGTVGINDIKTQFKLYPNPARNILYLETTGEIKKLEVYNIAGQIIKQNLVFGNHTSVKISELKKGLYFLKITDNKGDCSFIKFIKQ